MPFSAWDFWDFCFFIYPSMKRQFSDNARTQTMFFAEARGRQWLSALVRFIKPSMMMDSEKVPIRSHRMC